MVDEVELGDAVAVLIGDNMDYIRFALIFSGLDLPSFHQVIRGGRGGTRVK
jgi:hypothetical protein